MTESVIPPVRAGKINSSLDFEYDHHQYGEGGFKATGIHEWTFDFDAYVELTGLDIGADHPWVVQENGHTLRIVTEYQWMYSDYNGDSYTCNVESKAMRGSYSPEYYFTRAGHYQFDGEMVLEKTVDERQPHIMARDSNEIEHFPIWTVNVDGSQSESSITDASSETSAVESVHSGEEFVRGLHNGVFGPPVRARLHDLLVEDSPTDAVPVHEYGTLGAADEQAEARSAD
jgi:hypothetical protein